MKLLIIFLTTFCLSSLSVAEFSKDPVKKGLEIAQALDALNNGFVDQKADMKMILRDQRGKEASREIKASTLEVTGDGDKSLIAFEQPRTVKGTKFLSFTHKTGDDDQWLYLPRLKRVKRISSSNKDGAFMGSEFAYEDISSQEVEKYTYKYIKDEKVGEHDCYLVERTPTDKDSGYSKQLVWIVKGESELRSIKIHFFDKKDSHFKTLEMTGYKKYESKFWRPALMKMVNHSTKKSTDLVWSNYKFKSGLSKRDFDSNALKR